MKNITRTCLTCQSTFLADAREVNRGDARYCSIKCGVIATNEARPSTDYVCETCNVVFPSKGKDVKYCSRSCKSKSYRDKKKGLASLNIKKTYSLLQKIPCEICGWNDSSRDIHHITPISQGGIDELTNLVVLCPNHHRMAHRNLISEDDLRLIASSRTISSPLDPV